MSEYPDIDVNDHTKALDRLSIFSNPEPESLTPRDWPRGGHSDGPTPDDDVASQIRSVLPSWRAQRHSYPGWIIVPEARSSRTMERHKGVDQERSNPGESSAARDLEFAFQLIWRMEKCQCPIFDNQVTFFEGTLNRYLATDSDTSAISLSDTPDTPEVSTLIPSDISGMCDHVLLALLRYYREEGRIADWDRTREQLEIPNDDDVTGSQRTLPLRACAFCVVRPEIPSSVKTADRRLAGR